MYTKNPYSSKKAFFIISLLSIYVALGAALDEEAFPFSLVHFHFYLLLLHSSFLIERGPDCNVYGFGLTGDSQLGLGVKYNDGDDVLVDTRQMIGALQGKMISSVAGGAGMTVFLSESSGTVYTCGRQKNTGSGRSANESVLAPEPLEDPPG